MRGTVASLLRGIDRYAFYKINYLRIFAGIYQRYEAFSCFFIVVLCVTKVWRFRFRSLLITAVLDFLRTAGDQLLLNVLCGALYCLV